MNRNGSCGGAFAKKIDKQPNTKNRLIWLELFHRLDDFRNPQIDDQVPKLKTLLAKDLQKFF